MNDLPQGQTQSCSQEEDVRRKFENSRFYSCRETPAQRSMSWAIWRAATLAKQKELEEIAITQFTGDYPPTFRLGLPMHELEELVTPEQCSYMVEQLTAKQKELDAANATITMLREALTALHKETADYIRINNLGGTHHNRSMQVAKEALANSSDDWLKEHDAKVLLSILQQEAKHVEGESMIDIVCRMAEELREEKP